MKLIDLNPNLYHLFENSIITFEKYKKFSALENELLFVNIQGSVDDKRYYLSTSCDLLPESDSAILITPITNLPDNAVAILRNQTHDSLDASFSSRLIFNRQSPVIDLNNTSLVVEREIMGRIRKFDKTISSDDQVYLWLIEEFVVNEFICIEPIQQTNKENKVRLIGKRSYIEISEIINNSGYTLKVVTKFINLESKNWSRIRLELYKIQKLNFCAPEQALSVEYKAASEYIKAWKVYQDIEQEINSRDYDKFGEVVVNLSKSSNGENSYSFDSSTIHVDKLQILQEKQTSASFCLKLKNSDQEYYIDNITFNPNKNLVDLKIRFERMNRTFRTIGQVS